MCSGWLPDYEIYERMYVCKFVNLYVCCMIYAMSTMFYSGVGGSATVLLGDFAYPHSTTLSSGLSSWYMYAYCAESLNCEIVAEAALAQG